MARNTPQAIQQFRGTAAQMANYTGPVGELTVDTTDRTVRVQDGTTAGGHPLVNTTTAQTVAGVKTFVDAPLAPTPATKDKSGKLATTKYVDDAVSNIDPTDFPVGSKTQAGVIQVGDGLAVSAGVISVGTVIRPIILSPLDKININSGTTVVTSPFASNPADTHVKSEYKICADIQGQNIVAQASSQTDLTSYFFPSSALTSMVGGQKYYVFARHFGLSFGGSMWSEPREVTAEQGQVTPTGRTVYRHSSDKGSVIVYDEFGVTKNLFVADAVYRGTAQCRTVNTDIPGINNWPHYYFPTCTGNVIDSTTGYTDLRQIADLTPYAQYYTDAHFQAALAATLAPVIQTAKEATDLMIAAGDCPAAQHCRSQSVGIELQLPNIYQLLVMFAEGDVIDSLDPTLAANPTFALGWNGGKNSNSRWFLGGHGYTWSSTESDSARVCNVDRIGGANRTNRSGTNGVAPVAEI